MDFINKIVLDHVLHQPAVALVIAAVYAHIDHIISFALRAFSKDQIEKAIDAGAAAAKAEVEKVAKDVPHS